jgi:SAM-dependent methyltransferase
MSAPTTRSDSATAAPLPDFAPHLFAAEDRHFWFRARNTVIGRVVGSLVRALPPGYRVLEVGCGNGNVLRELERVCVRGTVVGVDLLAERLEFARRRTNCELRNGNIYELADEQPYDLIGMFDVLEHLEDDALALQGLSRALAPSGRVVLTVPAHQTLWSYADTHAGHYRRYNVEQLERALKAGGLRVEFCTQFMAALFPLLWVGRRLAALWGRPAGDAKSQRDLFRSELRVVPVANWILRLMLEWEAPLLARRKRLPLGASLLAIASKI